MTLDWVKNDKNDMFAKWVNYSDCSNCVMMSVMFPIAQLISHHPNKVTHLVQE